MAEKICTKGVKDEAVRFEFANGKVLMCDPFDLSAEIRYQCTLHGVSAKVGDSYAGAAKESDPAEFAYQQACATWQAMTRGEWTQKREGGGLLAEALSRATGRTLTEALTAIGALSEDKRKALTKVASIKVALAEIALEREQAKVKQSDLTNDPLDLLDL